MSLAERRAEVGEEVGGGDVLEKWMVGWTGFWAGRRVMLTVILVVMGVVFSWASRGVRWEADLLAFFSAESEEVKSMREAAGGRNLATQLRIDVHGGGGAEDVRAAARVLAERLKKRGETVWVGVEAGEMGRAYEVIRRGEEEKEIIVPLTGDMPMKRSAEDAPRERIEIVSSPTPAPTPQPMPPDEKIPLHE